MQTRMDKLIEQTQAKPPVVAALEKARQRIRQKRLILERCKRADLVPMLLAALERAHTVMCVEGENDLEEWQDVLAEVEAAIERGQDAMQIATDERWTVEEILAREG